MVLKFDPPEWLLQEYFSRKRPQDELADQLANVVAQSQQRKAAREDRALKLQEADRQNELLGVAKQKEAREAAAIGYNPNDPTAYTSMMLDKFKAENASKNAQAEKDRAMADWYRSGKSSATGGTVKPPTGYRFTENGDLEPIPGGPAALKVGQIEAKEAGLRNAAIQQADTVIGKVDQALPKVGMMSSGVGGAVMGTIPGTDARNLRADINTIKANLGFSTLQEMRRNSPTGGALGQIAVQELDMLQSTIASLDTAQSPDQLRQRLGEVKTHYQNWKNAVQQASTGGSQPTAPTGGFDADKEARYQAWKAQQGARP